MDGFNIVNYRMSGIKSLEKTIDLSFYKKYIKSPINFDDYRIKGIYGVNGTGKTSIVTSVKVLKNVILNSKYLLNDINQKKLIELINKKHNYIDYEVEFLAQGEDFGPYLYNYELTLGMSNKYDSIVIKREKLSCKKATSYKSAFHTVFDINEGRIETVSTRNELIKNTLINNTANLLEGSSVSSLLYDKILKEFNSEHIEIQNDEVVFGCAVIFIFGLSLFVYLDDNDIHDDYIINNLIFEKENLDFDNMKEVIRDYYNYNMKENIYDSPGKIIVNEKKMEKFEALISQMVDFIRVFKKELNGITVNKKPYGNGKYLCSLIMNYDGYDIDTEFESTGVKKLIKLFQYIKKMVNGEIVFIDEFDSNLHDVYLCALLEYLAEYGKGQLCFTSHNIGPMSVLKRKKKSIDFLSVDKTIYSWKKSGNYSPAALYRGGMIEGSPFNVDQTDFIGVFD